MAELLLNAPAQGQELIVPIDENTTSVNMNFDIADALFERVEDNLEIYFEESDSTLVLENFYTTYDAENIPDFLLADGLVSGEEFFAALDESLMPAAGPAAPTPPANDGLRFGAGAGEQLAGGVDALGGTTGGSGYGRIGFQGEFGSDGVDQTPTLAATSVSMLEDGVGRNPDTSFSPNNPNQEYFNTVLTGTLTGTDPDSSDLSYGIQGGTTIGNVTTLKNQYGTLTITNNPPNQATYTFELDDALSTVHKLAQGELASFTFTLTVTDGTTTSTSPFTVNLTGSNDRPIEIDPNTILVLGVKEDDPSQETDSVTFGVFDVDNGDSLTYLVGDANAIPEDQALPITLTSSMNGSYGTLSAGANGEYTYTISKADTQFLSEGQVVTEKFTVYAKDEAGAWVSHEITVNVTGTNDDPKVDVANSTLNVTLYEAGHGRDSNHAVDTNNPNQQYNGKLEAHATVKFEDVDLLDDLTFTVDGNTSITDDYGTFTLSNDVKSDDEHSIDYTFKYNPANEAIKSEIDALQVGQTKTLTYTIKADDGNGGIIEQQVSITIQGTNDAPEITSITNNGDFSATEDTDITVSGKIFVKDVDSDGGAADLSGQTISATSTYSNATVSEDASGIVTIEGQYGRLEIQANGEYTYTLYTAKDGADKYARVNSLGENDKNLTETFNITTKDSQNATDTEILTFTVNGSNDVPTLVINNPTHTTYDDIDDTNDQDSDNDNDGQTVTGSFTVGNMVDGNGGSVEISYELNGKTETFKISDKDLFDLDIKNSADDKEIITDHGKFVITGYDAATGTVSYKYIQNGAQDHLRENGTLQDKFDIKVSDNDTNTSDADSATGSITITIEDDVPTVVSDFVDANRGNLGDLTVGSANTTPFEASTYFDEGADYDGGEYTVLNANSSDEKSDGTVDYTFDWGVVNMNTKTGAYTVTANNSADNVSFEIQYEDKDHDKASVTVKGEVDNTPGGFINANFNLTTSDEALTPNGTLEGTSGEVNKVSDTKSFTFTSHDGLGYITISIGGVNYFVDANGDVYTKSDKSTSSTALDANGDVVADAIQGTHGYLKFDVIDNGNGTFTVNYTYTQTKTATHAANTDVKWSGDIFTIESFTDADTTNPDTYILEDNNEGGVGNKITVNIYDDEPTIVDNFANSASGDLGYLGDLTVGTASAEYNAADYFNEGADLDGGEYTVLGATSFAAHPTEANTTVFTFTWGTVSMNTVTGDYTVTANNANDNISFEIQYEDKDHDKASVTVKGEVDNLVTDFTAGNDLVTSDEALKPSGTLEGTAGEVNTATASSSFSFTSVDGVDGVTINNVYYEFDASGKATVPGVNAPLVLQLTNKGDVYTVTYTYTQTTAYDHAIGTDTKLEAEKFELESITNGNGTKTTVNDTITVEIRDDEPTIVDNFDGNLGTLEVNTGVTYNASDYFNTGADTFPSSDADSTLGKYSIVTDGDSSFIDMNTTSLNGIHLTTYYTFDWGTVRLSVLNGSYTITTNNSVDEISFKMQYTDADGDTKTVTVSGDVDNLVTDFTAGRDLTTSDEAFANANEESDDNPLLSDSDSFSFTSLDGVTSVTINNVAYTFTDGKATVPGANGNLTLELSKDGDNYTIKYTYTQDGVFKHPNADNTEDGVVADSFNLTGITNENGTTTDVTDTITATITDDVPVVKSKGSSTDDSSTEATVSNDIASAEITVKFGADLDGAKILSENSSTFEVGFVYDADTNRWSEINDEIANEYKFENGQHIIKLGNITMTSTDNVNWTVTYPADATPSDIIFEDADGDSTSHSFTTKPVVTPPLLKDAVLVDEEGLNDASNNSENVTWKLSDAFADGANFTLVGVAGASNGNITYTTDASGKLTGFNYELNNNLAHNNTTPDSGEGITILGDTLTVTYKDANGNTHTAQVKVNVEDDVPTIVDDFVSADRGNLGDLTIGTASAEYNAKDYFDEGADVVGGEYTVLNANSHANGTVAGTVDYTFDWGVVNMNTETGEYTVTANNSATDISFEIQFKDNDNDIAKVTVSGDVDNLVTGFTAGSDLVTSDEALKPNGTLEGTAGEVDTATASSSFSFTSLAGVDGVTINNVYYEFDASGQASVPGVNAPLVLQLTKAGDVYTVTYTYTQTTAYDHAIGADTKLEAERFELESITNGNGIETTVNDTITVEIRDDEPVINSKLTSATQGSISENADAADGTDVPGTATITENGTVSGELEFSQGADVSTIELNGNNLTIDPVTGNIESGLSLSITGGTITFGTNNTYTFTPNDVDTSTDVTLEFTITDADGDSETVKEVITVTPVDTPPAITDIIHSQVSEAYLPDGTKSDDNDLFPNQATSTTGKITATDAQGADLSFTWDIDNQPDLWTSEGNKVSWEYGKDADGKEDKSILIGTDGTNEVIKLTTTEGNNGEFSYTVELKQAVLHDSPDSPNTSDYNTDLDADNTLNDNAADPDPNPETNPHLEFGFNISDGTLSTPGKVEVEIQDDILELGQGTNSSSFVLDYFTTDTVLDFKGDTGSTTNVLFSDTYKDNKVGGLTFSAGTLTYNDDGSVTLSEESNQDVVLYNPSGADYTNGVGVGTEGRGSLDGEISHDRDTDISEALIIDLPDGEIAYAFNIELSCITTSKEAGANEALIDTGWIILYNGDKEVARFEIEGTPGDGTELIKNSYVTTGFDRIVVVGSNNGIENGFDSEFVVSELELVSPEGILAKHEGQLDVTGADGIATMVLDSLSYGANELDLNNANTIEIDGVELTIALENGQYTAKTAQGELYFTIVADNNGGWLMHQYQELSHNIELTFKATDKDGDSDTIGMVVESGDTIDPEFDIDPNAIVLDEATLEDGTNADAPETISDSFTITDANGLSTVTIAGKVISLEADGSGSYADAITPENAPYSISNIVITKNGDTYTVEYDITLDKNIKHDSPDNIAGGTDETKGTVSFDVSATDKAGNTSGGTINVNVEDDAPVIKTLNTADSDNDGIVDVEASLSDGKASAVISVDLGADMDGATIRIPSGATSSIVVEWDEDFGTWEVTDNGGLPNVNASYDSVNKLYTIVAGDITMTSSDNTTWNVSYGVQDAGRDGIIMYFTDGDGDKVSHEILNTYTSVSIDAPVTHILADDSVLSNGAHAPIAGYNIDGAIDFTYGSGDASEHSFTVNIDGQAKELTFVNNKAELEVNGGKLVFTLDEANSRLDYTFVQSEAFNHDGANDSTETDLADSFSVTIKDTTSGNSITSDVINIEINDDGPEAVSPTSTLIIRDDSNANITFDMEMGADSGAGSSITFNGVTVNYNDIAWNPSGTTSIKFGDATLSTNDGQEWIATMPKESGDTRTETVTITDADGDSKDVTLNAEWTSKPTDDDFKGQEGSGATIIEGGKYNVSIMLDTSGSMDGDGNAPTNGDYDDITPQVQVALEKFLSELFVHSGPGATDGEVNLQIVTFGWKIEADEFVLKDGQVYYNGESIYSGSDSAAAADEIISKLRVDGQGNIQVGGGTDYNSPIEQATDWFNLKNAADTKNEFENKAIFITDGNPSEASDYTNPITSVTVRNIPLDRDFDDSVSVNGIQVDRYITQPVIDDKGWLHQLVTFDDIAGDNIADGVSKGLLGLGWDEYDIRFNIYGKEIGDTWESHGTYMVDDKDKGDTDKKFDVTYKLRLVEDNGNVYLEAQPIVNGVASDTWTRNPNAISSSNTANESFNIDGKQAGETWIDGDYTLTLIAGENNTLQLKVWNTSLGENTAKTTDVDYTDPTTNIKFSIEDRIPGETWTENGYTLTLSTNGETGDKERWTLTASKDGNPSNSSTIDPSPVNQLDAALQGDGEFKVVGFKGTPDFNENSINTYFSAVADEIIFTDDAYGFFDPKPGSISGNSFESSVSSAGIGNDLIVGGMNEQNIIDAVKIKLNFIIDGQQYVPSINEAMLYIANHPEWFATVETSNTGDHDILIGGADNDIIFAQSGNDFILGDGKIEDIAEIADQLGLDADKYTETGLKNVEDADNDKNTADDSAELVNDLVTEAQLTGNYGKLVLFASEIEQDTDGADTIYAGEGNDVVFAGGGDDVIYGGAGDDIIFGGSGDDTIYSGAGNDILSGGAGHDTFVFTLDNLVNGESDTIVDFEKGDRIDLTAYSGPEYLIEIKDQTIKITFDDDASVGDEFFTIEVQGASLQDFKLEEDADGNIIIS